MKNYFKYLSILCISLMFTSCLVDDNANHEDNDKGPNLASFTNKSQNLGAISNGDEYVFQLIMEVKGPTILDMVDDVQLTVSVDPSSTAIEGTHFALTTNTLSLTANNNYTGFFPITMLTEGIIAPLDVSPVLKLVVSQASGGNVVGNGIPITITLNYLCFSDLAGTYAVEMRFIRVSDGTDSMHFGTDVINQTGVGQYRTEAVGHWEIDGGPGAIGGTAGFDFIDVCNVITIPPQNLVDLYSNIVEGVFGRSSVNPDTGVITFEYTVCFGGECREYFVTYTPL